MRFDEHYFIEDINVKDVDLKSIYDNFNEKLFDGTLPSIPIRMGNLKNIGGMVKSISKKKDGVVTIKPIEMVISSFYNRKDENVISGIIVHEMIHVFLDHNNMIDSTGSHGIDFKTKRKELKTKVDFDIPMTDTLRTSISDHIKTKTLDIVVLKSPNKKVVSVLKKGMIESPMLSVGKNSLNTSSLDYLVDKFDSKVIFDDYEIYFLQSNVRDLLTYPVAGKFDTMKYFLIDEDLFNKLITDSRLILKLDKTELIKRLEKLPDIDYRKSWIEKYLK